MIAYKVVKANANEALISANDNPEVSIVYRPNKKAVGINGTPVFVFATLSDAMKFASDEFNKNDSIRIWKCEAENMREFNQSILSILMYHADAVEDFWRAIEEEVLMEDLFHLRNAPAKTYIADSVTLIEEVYTYDHN